MNLSLNQSNAAVLRQEMKFSAAQMQSVEMLQCTGVELQQRVNQALVDNPLLVMERPVECSLEEAASQLNNGLPEKKQQQEQEWDGDGQAYREEIFERSVRDGEALPPRLQDEELQQEKRRYLFDSLTAPRGMREQLIEQIDQQVNLHEPTGALCKKLVSGYMDDYGLLLTPDDELCRELSCTPSELSKAVSALQYMGPPGIAARSASQCLLLQLEAQGLSHDALEWKIAQGYLEQVRDNRVPAIASALQVSNEEVNRAIDALRHLTPHPGWQLDHRDVMTVVPDVYIEREGRKGGWTVRLNDIMTPRLSIDKYYLKMQHDSGTPADARKYIREKSNEAQMLIDAIDNRGKTILRVAVVIAKFQEAFLESGSTADLKPMTLEDVARELDLAESTVSRAAKNKYASTPWGTFPFRDFFAVRGKGRSEDGGDISTHKIRQRLRELINAEDPYKPLSDQALSELLKNDGFPIERRTVAKYRTIEHIPGTSQRRRH